MINQHPSKSIDVESLHDLTIILFFLTYLMVRSFAGVRFSLWTQVERSRCHGEVGRNRSGCGQASRRSCCEILRTDSWASLFVAPLFFSWDVFSQFESSFFFFKLEQQHYNNNNNNFPTTFQQLSNSSFWTFEHAPSETWMRSEISYLMHENVLSNSSCFFWSTFR